MSHDLSLGCLSLKRSSTSTKTLSRFQLSLRADGGYYPWARDCLIQATCSVNGSGTLSVCCGDGNCEVRSYRMNQCTTFSYPGKHFSVDIKGALDCGYPTPVEQPQSSTTPHTTSSSSYPPAKSSPIPVDFPNPLQGNNVSLSNTTTDLNKDLSQKTSQSFVVRTKEAWIAQLICWAFFVDILIR